MSTFSSCRKNPRSDQDISIRKERANA